MSRHLMARFRHLHASTELDWQHGVALPHTKMHAKEDREEAISDGSIEEYHPSHFDTSNNSVAIANHGEQRYGLEVSTHQPWKDSPLRWGWKIQKQKGPDATDPDHWGYYFNLMNENRGSGVDYVGGAASREEAMANAEHNFKKHVDHLNANRPSQGGYDINDIMRKFDGGEL